MIKAKYIVALLGLISLLSVCPEPIYSKSTGENAQSKPNTWILLTVRYKLKDVQGCKSHAVSKNCIDESAHTQIIVPNKNYLESIYRETEKKVKIVHPKPTTDGKKEDYIVSYTQYKSYNKSPKTNNNTFKLLSGLRPELKNYCNTKDIFSTENLQAYYNKYPLNSKYSIGFACYKSLEGDQYVDFIAFIHEHNNTN